MQDSNKIRYLPTFYHDLLSTISYISDVLMNPIAAQRLADDIENAILRTVANPDIFEPYRPGKQLDKTYYKINVRNYFIFYSVEDGIMEISRLIYAKSNIQLI